VATRLGIELSPAACRLVEIDARAGLRKDIESRVRSFAVLPPSGPETDALLATLKGRVASVVTWSAASDHRQVVVTEGRYEAMRAEALQALETAGVRTDGVVADIAPIGGTAKRGSRRPVVVTLADSAAVMSAIDPLVRAGIQVRSVVTPAVALASIARVRYAFSLPGGIEVYVAIEESMSCVALMRDGVLTIARELPWGYVADTRSGATRTKEDLATRLALELDQFFDALGVSPSTAAQVCICGGVPELRSMTMPLMDRFDVEVEPFDSLFGIDAQHLPDPEADFRERIAELRLAWAVAADWPPYLNLLRARHRGRSSRLLSAAAIAAGVIAGVGGAWQLAHTVKWPTMTTAKPAPKPAPKLATANPPAPQPKPVGAPPKSTAPPAPAPATATSPAPAPVVTPRPVPLLAARRTAPTASLVATRVLTPTPMTAYLPVPAPPPAPAPAPSPVVAKAPAVSEPRRGASNPQPAASPKPAQPKPTTPVPASAVKAQPAPTPPPQPQVARQPQPTTSQPPPARVAPSPRPEEPKAPPPARVAPVTPPRTEPIPVPVQPRPVPAPAPRTFRPVEPKQEPVTPFEADLSTILYASDRKLAIVDGRIVGVGDTVRGARIIEIMPTVVMLRDAQGKLRRLALAGSGK